MRATRSILGVAAALSTLACSTGGAAGGGAPAQSAAPATYSVADMYQNTRFRGIGWSADSRTLLVSSDLSGIWNAYAIPRAGGAPQPLTHSTTNSVFALSFFPADRKSVV